MHSAINCCVEMNFKGEKSKGKPKNRSGFLLNKLKKKIQKNLYKLNVYTMYTITYILVISLIVASVAVQRGFRVNSPFHLLTKLLNLRKISSVA